MNRPDGAVIWIFWAATLAMLALLGAILFWFDPNHYSFYPVCLFHKFTGLLCPGCGSLRALHQLLHGNVPAAFHYNPLLVISLPAFVWFGALFTVKALRHEHSRVAFPAKWVWLLLGIGLAFSIWRNLPGSPFAMLSP